MSGRLKQGAKALAPISVRYWRVRRATTKLRAEFADRTVDETFRAIYNENVWGGDAGEFFSGGGSDQDPDLVYAAAANSFIASGASDRLSTWDVTTSASGRC